MGFFSPQKECNLKKQAQKGVFSSPAQGRGKERY